MPVMNVKNLCSRIHLRVLYHGHEQTAAGAQNTFKDLCNSTFITIEGSVNKSSDRTDRYKQYCPIMHVERTGEVAC